MGPTMKKLLLALLFVPMLAYGQEPANVQELRKDFIDGLASDGLDPKRCSFEYFKKSDEEHYVKTQCEQLPYECLFLIHPTEPAFKVVTCVDNPKYKAPGNKT